MNKKIIIFGNTEVKISPKQKPYLDKNVDINTKMILFIDIGYKDVKKETLKHISSKNECI